MASQETRQLSAVEHFLAEKKPPVPRIVILVVAGVAILVSLFHVYTAFFTMIQPYAQRTLALALIMILGFLTYPLGRRSWTARLNRFFALDVLFALLVTAVCVYVIWDFKGFVYRVPRSTTLDLIAGTVIILLLVELTRRVIGWPLVIVAAFFMALPLVSEHLPGAFGGPAVPWKRLVEIVWMQDFGIYGMPIQLLTSFLVIFMLLVGLLTVGGAGRLFIDISLAIAGRWTGGPAKVAVIASSLFGTMSGSSVANVVATGSFTIPMMKRLGFRPEFAGSVEAVASTGGQITPPIMALAAFLIAEFLKVSYFRVCLAALMPASLFYLSAFMQIHYRAVKTGLVGLPREEVPRLGPTMARAWPILLPILALFFFLARGYSLAFSGFYAILLVFLLTMFRKETRMSATRLAVAFETGGRMCVLVGIAMATVGIIIGTFFMSGLGHKIAALIVTASGGNLLIGLMITAVVCIILGMAVPTVIVYIMVLMVAIPALIDMGANPMAAHFFAFYYGIVSGLTPPVALTAFAAAGLAGTDMMRTGVAAFKLGLATYIVPFMFVYAPAMVAEGTAVEALIALASGSLAIIALASGIEGWMLRRANWLERLLLLGACLALVVPNLVTRLTGIGLILLVALLQRRTPYWEPLRAVSGLFRPGKK